MKMNLEKNKDLKKISKLSTIKCIVERSVFKLKMSYENIHNQIHIQELYQTIDMIMPGDQINLIYRMK
jgi:hypothetical protein